MIVFNGTFKGIIYSSGYVNDPTCLYVNGSGLTRYEFSIRLNQCGTLGRQEVHQPAIPGEARVSVGGVGAVDAARFRRPADGLLPSRAAAAASAEPTKRRARCKSNWRHSAHLGQLGSARLAKLAGRQSRGDVWPERRGGRALARVS